MRTVAKCLRHFDSTQMFKCTLAEGCLKERQILIVGQLCARFEEAFRCGFQLFVEVH